MKRIFKIILHPFSLPLIWSIFLLTNIFSTIRYLYILRFNGGETIIRLFLTGIWKSSIIFLILFLIVLLFWISAYSRNSLPFKNKRIFFLVTISSLFTFAFSQFLISLEKINYQNYLYSKFGLLISNVELIKNVNLFILIIFLGYIYCEKSLWTNKRSNFPLNKIMILICLSIITFEVAPTFLKFRESFSNINLSYESEFSDYRYISRLKMVVPEDKNIILPEQSWDWAVIGNPPIVRYFLYPRQLISSTYITDTDKAKNIKEAYFILLKNQSGNLSWPKINSYNKTIIFKTDTIINYQKMETVYKDDLFTIYKIIF